MTTGTSTASECTCHKFIRLHDGNCDVHGFVRKQRTECDDCGHPFKQGDETHYPGCEQIDVR